jgi:hypothetical protein
MEPPMEKWTKRESCVLAGRGNREFRLSCNENYRTSGIRLNRFTPYRITPILVHTSTVSGEGLPQIWCKHMHTWQKFSSVERDNTTKPNHQFCWRIFPAYKTGTTERCYIAVRFPIPERIRERILKSILDEWCAVMWTERLAHESVAAPFGDAMMYVRDLSM